MAELRVTTGEGEELTVPLDAARIVFGRDEACDFVLSEQRASRTHCAFEPVGRGWRVVDLQSSNGTWLGGKPVLGARLQSGDEIEIGRTILTYVGAAAGATPSARRPRRPRRIRMPWEVLAAPVLLAVAAYALVQWRNNEAHAAAAADWNRYAEARAALAQRESDEVLGRHILSSSIERLEGIEAAAEARRRLVSRLEDFAPSSGGDDAPTATAWEAGLRGVEAARDKLSAGEIRARLVALLERASGDREAEAAIAAALNETASAASRSAEADRRRSLAAAEAALDAGRRGEALRIWTGWLGRAPDVDRATERELAERMAQIRTEAREQAIAAMRRMVELHAAGAGDEAMALLDRSLEELTGTGYASWLETRGALLESGDSVTVGTGAVGVDTGSELQRERARALRALSVAEDSASRREFEQGARTLDEALAGLRDDKVRTTLTERRDDLLAEARLVGTLLDAVRESPDRFSPLRLPDGVYRVTGASESAVLVTSGRDKVALELPVESLPPEGFGQLVERASLSASDSVAAAVLLHDVGAIEAAEAAMRVALEDEALRTDASLTWARVRGEEFPDGGYLPHPRSDVGVVSQDEHDAIVNAEKIAEYTKDLAKLVDRVESGKAAKGIAKVAQAYAELEAARKFAEELIFDEVKYFYPYRDRMAEYEPVKKEVARRVEAVRAAWANPARATIKADASLEKLFEQIDDLELEIGYLGGDVDDLGDRADAVRKYLGHDLTVQTFWETEDDLALIRSNEERMATNASMETEATDDEREQVRITNLYRIMFGHRGVVLINDKLVRAARGHSDDMARLGFFDHFSPVPGKRSPADRVAAEGYGFISCSENIHMGSGTPQGAHDSWIGSSGHHRNLLSPAWKEMGTGRSGRHWTQKFGYQD